MLHYLVGQIELEGTGLAAYDAHVVQEYFFEGDVVEVVALGQHAPDESADTAVFGE